MMTRVCATHEVVDCPMCGPVPEPRTTCPECGATPNRGWAQEARASAPEPNLYDRIAASAEGSPHAEPYKLSAPEQGEPPADLVDLFMQAIRYGIEVESDYFGNGQNDEEYIKRPALDYADRAASGAQAVESYVPQVDREHAAWCYLPADHEGLCEGDQ